MNARKFLNVRVSLTLTSLALTGALAISALTTACGGGSGSGGAAGNSGNGGAAGNSGNGGGNGNGGNSGGGNGGSGGGSSCADPATDGINFCNGKAQGLMEGYAYIALGSQDTATDPVCAEDPKKPDVTRAIGAPPDNECSGGQTCPTTGRTIWNNAGKLCITGTIPTVSGTDYLHNWGLQIGLNTSSPPAAEGGQTFGELNTGVDAYKTITVTTSGDVAPKNTAIRVVIHLKDMLCTDNPYCATLKTSGKSLDLTSFNTACWDASGKDLTAADLPNIDKIGIQVSSDTSSAYTVTNFCLESVVFGK